MIKVFTSYYGEKNTSQHAIFEWDIVQEWGPCEVQVLELAVLPFGPYDLADTITLRSRRSYGVGDGKKFREKITMQSPGILKI